SELIGQEVSARVLPRLSFGGGGAGEAFAIGPVECKRTVLSRQRKRRNWRGKDEVQPVLFQFARLHDLRMEAVQYVSDGGHAKTRRELLGAGRAAEFGGGFEQQHLAAGFRQQGRADEPVVPAADDDDIK